MGKELRNRGKEAYRSILRRNIDRKNREKLDNKEFTIISSNCVGGIITHDLGKRFDSPTVNLFFYPADFLQFVKNLQHYILESELRYDEEKSRILNYPVGILDDITLYFVHFSTFQEAKEKWEKRSKRIHWDNLFFILVQQDGCTEEQVREFLELPYPHKVVFTENLIPEYSKAVYNKEWLIDGKVRNLCKYKGKNTGARWIDDFDYVKFLNGQI